LTIRAGEQAPPPFGESLALVWPQATGQIAGCAGLFAIAYLAFQRREARA
jgi:ABC-2 type transport system permease protein